ncbi:hypothetical protein V8B55DRAFT_1561209 [Mucor lusitanicus]
MMEQWNRVVTQGATLNVRINALDLPAAGHTNNNSCYHTSTNKNSSYYYLSTNKNSSYYYYLCRTTLSSTTAATPTTTAVATPTTTAISTTTTAVPTTTAATSIFTVPQHPTIITLQSNTNALLSSVTWAGAIQTITSFINITDIRRYSLTVYAR